MTATDRWLRELSRPGARREVVGEAMRDPEAHAQLRARVRHTMSGLYRESPSGVQGSLDRTLASLDSDLEPDHPVCALVAGYRDGLISRAHLLADPRVRALLANHWGTAAP